jgi:hypothetical protein
MRLVQRHRPARASQHLNHQRLRRRRMHASGQEGDQRRIPALLSRRAGISRKPVIHYGNDLICARPQNPALSPTDLTPPALKPAQT